jgi:hypothetical protein
VIPLQSARARKYGISQRDLEIMLEASNGLCAICEEPFGDETPCIDHDHVTLRTRGLLLRNCNSLLGMAADRPDVLLRAAEYLTGLAYDGYEGTAPAPQGGVAGARSFAV